MKQAAPIPATSGPQPAATVKETGVAQFADLRPEAAEQAEQVKMIQRKTASSHPVISPPPPSGIQPVQGVFQYSHRAQRSQDMGKTADEVAAFYHQQGWILQRVWSLDGVDVFTDHRNAQAAEQLPIWGYPRTANYVDTSEAMDGSQPELFTRSKFNRMQRRGFFEARGQQRQQILAEQQRNAELDAAWGGAPAQADAGAVAPGDTAIHVASVGALTHLQQWGQVGLQTKLDLLYDAFDQAFRKWKESYDAAATYIFTAPEYYFRGDASHFLAEGDAATVWASMHDRFQGLPSNMLVLPGTVGWEQQLDGAALQAYQAAHTAKKATLTTEMQQHGLSAGERFDVTDNWGQEPAAGAAGPLRVFHNQAPVFRGGAAPASYTKRYESVAAGATDRSAAEVGAGYFHIGEQTFDTQVNGIPIKLEICADNSFESIHGSPYEGVHIVLASHFGPQDLWSAVHGQTYIHTDSTGQQVVSQRDNAVAQDSGAAGARDMDAVPAAEVFAHQTEGNVTLSFFRVAHRGGVEG